MNRIRDQMPGTTVVQKFNQGLSRLYECREGIKRRGPFLGTFLGKQKGTKENGKKLKK
jgi:hypothetical protein